jgi:hypothetical protein
MARRTLSALAAILAALGVSSLALVAATPAHTAVQAGMGGNEALALVSPQGESTYKAAQAEGLGNVVDARGYKTAQAEGYGNVVDDRG